MRTVQIMPSRQRSISLHTVLKSTRPLMATVNDASLHYKPAVGLAAMPVLTASGSRISHKGGADETSKAQPGTAAGWPVGSCWAEYMYSRKSPIYRGDSVSAPLAQQYTAKMGRPTGRHIISKGARDDRLPARYLENHGRSVGMWSVYATPLPAVSSPTSSSQCRRLMTAAIYTAECIASESGEYSWTSRRPFLHCTVNQVYTLLLHVCR